MGQVKQHAQTLTFSGSLRFGDISEVLTALSNMPLTAPLTLDFSQIEALDTVAISLILEIQRQLQRSTPNAAQVHLVGVSDNLRSLMQLYGVDTFLLN